MSGYNFGAFNPVVAIIIVAVFVVILGLVLFFKKKQVSEGNREQKAPETKAKEGEVITDKGKYPAYLIEERDGKLPKMYPVRIKEPIGEQVYFDASMPAKGWRYFIKKPLEGGISEVAATKGSFDIKNSPQMAWIATHWDILDDVLPYDTSSMWKDAKTWLVVLLIVVTFIVSLVTIAG